MDLSSVFTILTILIGFLSLIIANYKIIYDFRVEIRNDQNHLDNRWYAAIKSIEAECKDFHERLLEIESRRK